MDNKELTSKEFLESLIGSKFQPKSKADKDCLEIITSLYNKGAISKELAQVSLAKYEVTKSPIGGILISNGFVSQERFIKTLLELNPDYLINEETISEDIDYNILLHTNTMILAETKEDIFFATLGREPIVRTILSQHVKGKNIIFKPANVDIVSRYLKNLEYMFSTQEGFIELLLRKCLKKRVSDIFIEPPVNGSYSILGRIDDIRRHLHEGDEAEYRQLVNKIKTRSNMDTMEKRRYQDGAFQMQSRGKFVDFRVNSTPSTNGEVLAIRVLDPDSINPRLRDLGISKIIDLEKGASEAHGLVLITGPVGSGKTTTQTSLIQGMNRIQNAIFTVENPVEYNIPYVTQVNANKNLGTGFDDSIRSFLRANGDIMVVGEIRDAETARTAIKGAQTGRLVIGTLHTNSIKATVARLRDIGIEPYEIVELLRCILVQRLVRTVCKSCSGDGCLDCEDTGYKGRTVVSECSYFQNEEDVQSLINGQVKWESILQDAINKAKAGITDYKEIIRVFGESGRLALIENNVEVDL